jgi:tetratricopeptide (TPR) repeat protein
MTSEHDPSPARAAAGLVRRLSAGDFDSLESRRLTATLQPLSLLLRAVERITRADRIEAWRDVHAALAAAPRNGLVNALAARLLYVLGDFGPALAAAKTAFDLGVVSAGMLRYHQARNLGCYDVACAALEDVLRSKQETPSTAVSHRVLEYALEHLLALYFDHHHDEAAAAAAARYDALARGSFTIGLRKARIYERGGRPDEARRAMREALHATPSDPASLLKAAPILLEIGAFDEIRAVYASLRRVPGAPVAEALAQLALWTGDLQRALDHADELG